jgi:hypothetical protein
MDNGLHATRSAPAILVVHRAPIVGLMLQELVQAAGAGGATLALTAAGADKALATENFAGALLGVDVNHDEILPIAARLSADGLPFVVWGALTALPDLYGLDHVPRLSTMAEPDQIAAAFARVGVPFGSARPIIMEN